MHPFFTGTNYFGAQRCRKPLSNDFVGGMNDCDRPDTTRAGLRIIIVRCVPKLLAK